MEYLKSEITSSENEDCLTVVLSGTLDHHAARGAREQIDAQIAETGCRRLVLDLAEVDFMDSAGIGLILGRLGRMNDVGGELVIRRAGQSIMKLITMAGIDRYVKIER